MGSVQRLRCSAYGAPRVTVTADNERIQVNLLVRDHRAREVPATWPSLWASPRPRFGTPRLCESNFVGLQLFLAMFPILPTFGASGKPGAIHIVADHAETGSWMQVG